MPLTPLHIGPALLLKQAAGQKFSLPAFLAAQMLLDLEPGLKLLGLIKNRDDLHAWHTWTTGAGVVVLATVVGVLVGAGRWGWWRSPSPTAWISGLSAAVGVVSHLLLDGLYHADVAAGLGCPGLSGVVPQGWLDVVLLVALVVGFVAMTLSSKRP